MSMLEQRDQEDSELAGVEIVQWELVGFEATLVVDPARSHQTSTLSPRTQSGRLVHRQSDNSRAPTCDRSCPPPHSGGTRVLEGVGDLIEVRGERANDVGSCRAIATLEVPFDPPTQYRLG